MKISNVTIGSDPELFIINEETGKVVSSIGLIPGVKGEPWTGEDMPKGFGLETDNILAEFNIPPVTDRLSFINNIEYMKNYINQFVKNHNPKLGIKCSASEEVDSDQLDSPEAKLFGCDPDYNAYTESENVKPKGESTNLRSAGFHIHIGYDDFNTNTSVSLIKYLDFILGISSVILDTDTKRRSLYGKAGSFRLTSYGVEYRTLSSAMMSTTARISLVYLLTERAIYLYNHGISIPISQESVRNIIDNSDKVKAESIFKTYNEYYNISLSDLCAE